MLNAGQLKIIVQKELDQGNESGGCEPMALVAAFPESVMNLSTQERQKRVRQGMDSLILIPNTNDEHSQTRGFVRVVLKVPLHHPQAQTFGVYVEVQQSDYEKLKIAFKSSEEVEVTGTLANKLPLLEDAYGTKVWVKEFGDHRRTVVTEAEHELLLQGPKIGKLS
jgi:hypothetical protein